MSSQVPIFLVYGIAFFGIVYLLTYHYWRLQMMVCPELLNDATPTQYFPRKKDYSLIHTEMIRYGYESIKQRSVLVCIMVRDIGDRMSSVQERIYKLVREFKKYHILVVENNSADDTRLQLKKWRRHEEHLTILGCDEDADVCHLPLASMKTIGHSTTEKRISKMAYLRNMYLDEVKKIGYMYDYTIMWDIDVIGNVYRDGVINSIGHMESKPYIEMISAYGIYRVFGRRFYYDTYAHQNIGQSFDIKTKLSHDITTAWNTQYEVGDPLVPVESGFGGFAIYKTKCLMASHVKYSMSPDGKLECEHTRLHKHLKYKYMNPSMIHLILHNP